MSFDPYRSNTYQVVLIGLGVIASVLLGIFFLREVYPEYKIYQQDYLALEEFRSSYTGQPMPSFKQGVDQIVLEREDKGPPTIDRCTSCHVALQIPYFSPTKIGYDLNGNILLDENGLPVKVPNDEYIWAKLDQKIESLTADKNFSEAEKLKALKIAQVGENTYDVTKVLAMHPLIGRETRPFEFHPTSEYGCTSCHNGNGQGLTTVKAHGPVFDGQYEVQYIGPTPKFLESDPKNDPKFARVFNGMPGSQLLFQTTPIFVGALIEAKCVQCHQTSSNALQGVVSSASHLTERKNHRVQGIQRAYNQAELELVAYLLLKREIEKQGVANTVKELEEKKRSYSLTPAEQSQLSGQLDFLLMSVGGQDGLRIENAAPAKDVVLQKIDHQMQQLLGSQALVNQLDQVIEGKDLTHSKVVSEFILANKDNQEAKGSLFVKFERMVIEEELSQHVLDNQFNLEQAIVDSNALTTDIDRLTQNLQRGQNLYMSQGCYACHRIAGTSRGGVGPELTQIGKGYPWLIKRKLMWPQGDLPTSTMPNQKLDYEEIEDLMTFLLAQQGESKAVSEQAYKIGIQQWEAGKKLEWEKPVSPSKMQDLRYSMTLFATEGCAACHRLKGFESNVGFAVEKEKKEDFEALYKEKEWFSSLFPEMTFGSEIVKTIDQHAQEIDARILSDVRQNSILEEIEKRSPGTIEAFYHDFKFALRAKNADYAQKADQETDPLKKKQILEELQDWKDRVKRVLMIYIQEYGLGRLIGPRPNWAGVYRSDEWLMEHFRNPASHVPNSIMPVFPFDDTKFYALTYMLDVLGVRNREFEKKIWQLRGFNPEKAYEIHCAQCHGEFKGGNGPVAEWIYPIPKNLRNAEFLRNLTKERVFYSIVHGIKGTPMPPWGEAPEKPTSDGIPVLSHEEIRSLVDWLYSSLPGGGIIKSDDDVPKWKYSPQDALRELYREGNTLPASEKPLPYLEIDRKHHKEESPLSALPKGEGYYAMRPSLNKKTAFDFIPRTLALIIPTSTHREMAVDEVFETVPNSFPSEPEKNAYFIKKHYYTPANIEQGKLFFQTNCAVCHGNEADGTGVRAGVMQDAKPRMLTNLDWLATRDDLRLLRSIKFGVPGTSMTPWGDLTTSLQRLQLVIFIRSLTDFPKKREELLSQLYQAFDRSKFMIEEARSAQFSLIDKWQQELNQIKIEESSLAEKVESAEKVSPKALELYQKRLLVTYKLEQQKEVDQILVDLENEIDKEKALYKNLGEEILSKMMDEASLQTFLKMLALYENTYSMNQGRLVFEFKPEKESALRAFKDSLINQIEKQVVQLEKEKQILQGKIGSHLGEELVTLTNELQAFVALKKKILTGYEEALRSITKQKTLLELFHNQLKDNKLQP